MAGLNKYQAYPEYRDSGMEWCNELPLNWKKTKLRWLSNIFAGGTPSKNVIDYWENGTVPWISSGAVNQGYIVEPSTYISNAALENSSAKWIPKGALVVALAGQGKTKGMVAQLGINTTCNQSMAAIVLYKKNQSRYIFWWLISNYQNIRNMAGGDLRDGLNLELLGDIQCPKPRNDESSKIALFLDHETAKIDNLIEKQQQLIELLKEKRQAVISHAVTKGLNPDVPMKDSGVEWLGNIPEHWMLKRAKFIFRKMQRPISKHAGIITAFRDGHVTLRQNKRTDGFTFAIKEIGYQGVLKGDLVIHAMDGFAGAIGVSDSNGKCSPVCSVCIPYEKTLIYTYYYGYLVRQLAVTNFIQSLSKGIRERSTEFRFNEFAELSLPIPNYEEQMFIFKHIKKKEENIEELLQKQLQQIELLKERRTALISAAVTGKIDLRDWTPPASSSEESLTTEEATA